MKKHLFLSFLLLFFYFTSFAQISKGFNAIEKKNYEDAKKAFRSVLGDAEDGAAAYFGLGKALLLESDNADSLIAAVQNLMESEELLKKVDAKQKQKLMSDGVTANNCQTQKKAAGDKAWKAIIAGYKSGTEAGMNNAFHQMEILRSSGFFQKNKSEDTKRWRRAIVGQAWKTKADYQSLSDLLRFHGDFIPYQRGSGQNMSASTRLWDAFMKEKSPDYLDSFKVHHPNHWAAQDCGLANCAAAFKSEDASQRVKYFVENPTSTVSADVLKWWMNKLGSKAADVKSELSAKDAALASSFEQLQDIYKLYSAISSGQSFTPDNAKAMVKKNAPSDMAWHLMILVVDDYLEKHQWENALSLVKEVKPLFPNVKPANCGSIYYENEAWFDKITEILSAPDPEVKQTLLSAVNTEASESNPFISGEYLYFTGDMRKDGVGKQDPFRVKMEKDMPSGNPEIVTGLATADNESLLSITADGSEAIVLSNDELFQYANTAKGWTKVKSINQGFPDLPYIGKAALSADGQAMIFAAKQEKPGLFIGDNLDLYVSIKGTSGTWGAPSLLPANVNTAFAERGPYLHADGHTLYFASNGHVGLGGMDIFMTKRLDDTWANWTNPVNLGKQINTAHNDLGMQISVSNSGKIAYCKSEGAGGKNDLYAIGLPDRASSEAVKVVKVNSNMPNTLISVRNEDEVELSLLRTDHSGNITLSLLESKNIVKLSPPSDTIFCTGMTIDLRNTPSNSTLPEELKGYSIKEMLVGAKSFELPNVIFDGGQSTLQTSSFNTLDKFYQFLSLRKIRVMITAHCNEGKDDAASQKLADERAKSVKNYLSSLGYPEALITTSGKGKNTPLVSGDAGYTGRKENMRRVEFKFLTK